MTHTGKPKEFEDLQGIFYISYQESEKALLKTFHIHDAYEIMLVVSDGVTLDVNDETYPVPRGSLLLFNTFDLHRIRFHGSNLYKRYVLWFKHHFLDEFDALRYRLLRCFYMRSSDKPNLLRLNETQYQHMRALFDRLDALNQQEEHESSLLLRLVLSELLVSVNDLYYRHPAFVDPLAAKDAQAVYKAIQYIHAHYFADIRQEQLAKQVFLNKRTLNESFSKITGSTIGQYILHCRITSAKALLVSGMPVSDVCEKTGFGNLSNFSRTFRNHVRLSPKQYAMHHQQALPYPSANKQAAP